VSRLIVLYVLVTLDFYHFSFSFTFVLSFQPTREELLKETTEFSFLNDNYVLDLRNLGAEEYQEAGTMPHLIEMWRGEASVTQTAQAITDSWNAITEKYGLTEQRDFYRKVLGLPKYVEPINGDQEEAKKRLDRLRTIILSVTIPIGVLALLLGLVVAKQRHTLKYHTRDVKNAPTSGTIALLFTDIEDSTALWETDRDAMQKSLTIHNNVIRKLIDHYDAYEVKTVGDSFMIAVDSADKAVQLANDIQEDLVHADWPLQLATMPSSCTSFFPQRRNSIIGNPDPARIMFKGLRVRIGIHVGQSHIGETMDDKEIETVYDKVTKGFDYFGPIVNTAARIEDAAFGGQTMVSNDVHMGLSEDVKSDCHINIIGNLELKGVKDEMCVHSVLPISLRGRKFNGVYRRRSSLADSLVTSKSRNSYTESDVMSLTPVELQKGMLTLQNMVSKLHRENDALKTKYPMAQISSYDNDDDDLSFDDGIDNDDDDGIDNDNDHDDDGGHGADDGPKEIVFEHIPLISDK
jgi:class 3 adenylate cyclase